MARSSREEAPSCVCATISASFSCTCTRTPIRDSATLSLSRLCSLRGGEESSAGSEILRPVHTRLTSIAQSNVERMYMISVSASMTLFERERRPRDLKEASRDDISVRSVWRAQAREDVQKYVGRSNNENRKNGCKRFVSHMTAAR